MEESGQNEDFRDKIATVDDKGKRIWIYPKKQSGKYVNRRQWVGYLLLGFLFAGPFIRIGGEPLLLVNIIERKFVMFGGVFWPADIFLFAIGMVGFVILIILFTVVFGRLFCGWVCPQTVFMEHVFRKIEYWIDGDWKEQERLDKMSWNAHKISKRVLKWSIFWIISFIIANTFLAYIIGTDELFKIVTDSPAKHVGSLIALIIFTSVFFAVFAWFREQVCTTVCPYGRLQGVLLDKHSIVVAYDYERGESRAKINKSEDRTSTGKGDCIDCHQCVNVCPTGIDIRNGTQLECINCTLCIDACDFMMVKVGMVKGLIRYDSEVGIQSKQKWKLSKRAKLYVLFMFVIVGFLATLVLTRIPLDVTILRVDGTSYQKIDEDSYSNFYKGSFMNKTNEDQMVSMKVLSGNATVEIVGGPFLLKKGEHIKRELVVKMNLENLIGSKTPVNIGIYSGDVLIEEENIDFAGPGF